MRVVNQRAESLYHFGGFTLDLQRRGLFRDGRRIHLTSKPLETLIYLVQNRDRAIEKRELLEAVWEGAFVTEDTLVHAVMEIRLALSDDKDDPQFVQTVPRHGYRFVGEVSAERRGTFESIAALPSSPIGVGQTKAQQIDKAVKLKPRYVSTLLIVSLVFIGLVGIFLLARKFSSLNAVKLQPHIPFQNAQFAKLTTSGRVTDSVVLPDGKYVIYSLSDEGKESLWLKQIATPSNVQIAEPTDIAYQGLTIAPKGDYLYFVASDRKRNTALYRMPVLGGAANKLSEDLDSAVTFSPNGTQIAFVRGYPQNGETALMNANADGTRERKLVSLKRPEFFPTQRTAPAWSPDGKVIACPTGKAESLPRYMTLTEIRVDDASTRPITTQRWSQIAQVTWLADGSGLILTAKENELGPFQIWHLSYPDGKALKLTNDLSDYLGVSLTTDSSVLVTRQTQTHLNIWSSPDGSENRARQITFSNLDGPTSLSWTPDGRIIYVSRVSGNQDIWVMNQNGGEQRQLTMQAGDNNWPSISPDGRYIVFMSNRTGANHIWRMNIDGTNLLQLTNGQDERWPHCTPDGKSVVFAATDGLRKLFKVSIDGGSWIQLTSRESSVPVISPDGSLVATGYFEDPEGLGIAIYSTTGGDQPLKTLDLWSPYFRWSRDGRAIQYVSRQSVANIISYPIEGGASKPLTNFKTGGIATFQWSRSGQLVWSRRIAIADVVVLNDRSVR